MPIMRCGLIIYENADNIAGITFNIAEKMNAIFGADILAHEVART